MENKKTSRASNIELLRIVVMFMVVLYHVYGSQYGQGIVFDGANFLIIQSLVPTLCMAAVNVFVFISGYYSIKHKVQPFVSLITQVLFYSLLFGFIGLLLGDVAFARGSVMYLLPVSTAMWWFVTIYVILYIVAPYINAGMQSLSKRHNTFIVLSLLFFDIVAFLTNNEKIGIDGYTIYHFIVIYSVARYFGMYKININRAAGFVLYIAPLSVLFAIILLYEYKSGTTGLNYFLWRYNSPFMIISAIGLFFFFKNLKIKSTLINRISAYSFAVYLIHQHPVLWKRAISFIYDLNIRFESDLMLLVVILFLFSIAIYAISTCIDILRQYAMNPVNQKISNLITKKLLN